VNVGAEALGAADDGGEFGRNPPAELLSAAELVADRCRAGGGGVKRADFQMGACGGGAPRRGPSLHSLPSSMVQLPFKQDTAYLQARTRVTQLVRCW
jgi:hypothetical protein